MRLSLYEGLAVITDSQSYIRYHSGSIGERLWDAVASAVMVGRDFITDDGFTIRCNDRDRRPGMLIVARRLVPDAPKEDVSISYLPEGSETAGGIAHIEKDGEAAAVVIFVKRVDGVLAHRYIVLSHERFWPFVMMRFL